MYLILFKYLLILYFIMENNDMRSASHAGSWYSKSKAKLTSELKSYLNDATKHIQSDLLKGIIVPHAGYRWSGPTAAWGYVNINPEKYDRVVLMGPSHHIYFSGCALTQCSKLSTPIGDITVDVESIKKLSKMKGFTVLSGDDDENVISKFIYFIQIAFLLKYKINLNNKKIFFVFIL
jgi:MEMO1 family protein